MYNETNSGSNSTNLSIDSKRSSNSLSRTKNPPPDIITQVYKPSEACNFTNQQSNKPYSFTPSCVGKEKKIQYPPGKILPPQEPRHYNKKTLVLDLDETLVHSAFTSFPKNDVHLNVDINGINYNIYVLVRPKMDTFLEEMAKYFEIVIFTASLEKYADPLLNKIDPKRHCTHRLFRDKCTFLNGVYVKDLRKLNRKLKDIIIVDNSPVCFSLNNDNGLPIDPFFDNKKDNDLMKLVPILKFLSEVDDVRNYIYKFIKNDSINYIGCTKLIEFERKQLDKNIKIVKNDSSNEITDNLDESTSKAKEDKSFEESQIESNIKKNKITQKHNKKSDNNSILNNTNEISKNEEKSPEPKKHTNISIDVKENSNIISNRDKKGTPIKTNKSTKSNRSKERSRIDCDAKENTTNNNNPETDSSTANKRVLIKSHKNLRINATDSSNLNIFRVNHKEEAERKNSQKSTNPKETNDSSKRRSNSKKNLLHKELYDDDFKDNLQKDEKIVKDLKSENLKIECDDKVDRLFKLKSNTDKKPLNNKNSFRQNNYLNFKFACTPRNELFNSPLNALSQLTNKGNQVENTEKNKEKTNKDDSMNICSLYNNGNNKGSASNIGIKNYNRKFSALKRPPSNKEFKRDNLKTAGKSQREFYLYKTPINYDKDKGKKILNDSFPRINYNDNPGLRHVKSKSNISNNANSPTNSNSPSYKIGSNLLKVSSNKLKFKLNLQDNQLSHYGAERFHHSTSNVKLTDKEDNNQKYYRYGSNTNIFKGSKNYNNLQGKYRLGIDNDNFAKTSKNKEVKLFSGCP